MVQKRANAENKARATPSIRRNLRALMILRYFKKKPRLLNPGYKNRSHLAHAIDCRRVTSESEVSAIPYRTLLGKNPTCQKSLRDGLIFLPSKE